ncbi:PDZ domain containing protein [Nitzschia inconspicua]|uniref:PDZ domain containing protein n=1 Tax=Nitzschia inconspicua TaxID=303405 RepID=A0A9K3PZS8_9STRA|nr:PDZ domain containing protein [Nitzschia inconspicua]
MISSGFSFNDGEQILVSIQKPFGLVLEQDDQDGVIFVAEVDPLESGAKAGVQVGDILVSVQNASTASVQLEEVLEFIVTRCPRVVNLRFQRATPPVSSAITLYVLISTVVSAQHCEPPHTFIPPAASPSIRLATEVIPPISGSPNQGLFTYSNLPTQLKP